jgi:beta-lactam-binding protein with PASTA domain
VSIRQSEAHSTVAGRLGAVVLVAAIFSLAVGLLPDNAAAANGATVTASDGTSLAIPGETVYVTSPNYSTSGSCDLVFVDSDGTATGSETCAAAPRSPLQGSLVVPLTAAYGVATVYVCEALSCSGSIGAATAQGAAQGTITIERAVSVPNVVGMQGGAAVAALGSVGLAAQASGPLAGTVTAQTPAAGVGVKPKSAVRVTLVVVLVQVPDLHGLTAIDANRRLSVIHLRLLGVLTAPGTVVNQNPEPNQFVPEYSGVTVALLVPLPSPSPTQSPKIAVPTFTGLRNRAAASLASKHGLETRWRGARHGTVTSQSPAPGAWVDPGREIDLTSDDPAPAILTVFVLGLIGLAAAGAVGGLSTRWIRRVHARRARRWFSTHVDMTVTTGVRTELRPDNGSPSVWPAVEMSWSSLRSSSLSLHGGAK